MSYATGPHSAHKNGPHGGSETEEQKDEYEYDDEGFDTSVHDTHNEGTNGGSGVNNGVGLVTSHGGETGARSGRTVMSSGEGYSGGGGDGDGGSYGGMSGVIQAVRPNTLPASGEPHVGSFKASAQFIPPATSVIPLSSPEHEVSSNQSVHRTLPPGGPQAVQVVSPLTKLDSIRSWSFNTYKFTKQVISEKLGRTTRTVDAELEAQIELLRETRAKYANVLHLTVTLTQHFQQVATTQRALGDAFSDLSQKNPELREEFAYNAETQKILFRNGETLIGALNFFTSTMTTLCSKTIDDTLLTVKQYEAARVEFDAYRLDLEGLNGAPRDLENMLKLEKAQQRYQTHKEKFERLGADVAIKMKFLDENRVKVMHKQLLLLHNAVASYFSGNQTALEETLKQFNIKLKTPNSDKPSWLESHN